MTKPLNFRALRRRFELLRVLSQVAFGVVVCGFIALAWYVTT